MSPVLKRKSSIFKSRVPDLGTIHLITLSLNEFRSFITLQGDPFDMALFADDMVWV